MCAFSKVHVHEQSVIETRQSRATTSEDNSFFSQEREQSCLRQRIQTCSALRTRQMLYQLSHRGSSAGQAESLNVIQGQRRLSPDEQGYSISVI